MLDSMNLIDFPTAMFLSCIAFTVYLFILFRRFKETMLTVITALLLSTQVGVLSIKYQTYKDRHQTLYLAKKADTSIEQRTGLYNGK